MTVLQISWSTLAVALIFCVWQLYHEIRRRRSRLLRDRVAYMLWVAATRGR